MVMWIFHEEREFFGFSWFASANHARKLLASRSRHAPKPRSILHVADNPSHPRVWSSLDRDAEEYGVNAYSRARGARVGRTCRKITTCEPDVWLVSQVVIDKQHLLPLAVTQRMMPLAMSSVTSASTSPVSTRRGVLGVVQIDFYPGRPVWTVTPVRHKIDNVPFLSGRAITATLCGSPA